jgi:urease accessory protein
LTGGGRALGSIVVVDPSWSFYPVAGAPLGDTAGVLPLAGPAAMVSALAPDALALRRCLDTGLAHLTGTSTNQPVPAR